jgi:Pyruvate/2-oxoacid:ferredoxin oxidoreductase delta subunit
LLALLEDGHRVTRSVHNGTVAAADQDDHVVLGQFAVSPSSHDGSVRFLDITGKSADLVRAAVREQVGLAGAQQPGGWKPWFPVIDYDRCTNCMQCLTFCLFDVYGVDGQEKIEVRHQDHCKTDCPACSRVCPEAAILFPKYKKGPINGDVVREEDLQREAMKVDISALLGGDLYGALRTRQQESRQRFSTERDESKALLERKRCLAELKKTLDIPDEVLMTLPSAGDIADRARRAKEKAARRAERSQSVQDQRPVSPDEWGI